MDSKWIFNPRTDLALFMTPALLGLIGMWLPFRGEADLPTFLGAFIFLKVLSEGHIVTTLYRTYLDREELRRHQLVYIWFPILYFALACPLYFVAPLWFWRILAYALFVHLVRQQYGWMRIITEKGRPSWRQRLDTLAIYLATIIPFLIFHVGGDPNGWFQDGDIWTLPPIAKAPLNLIFWLMFAGYLGFLAWERRGLSRAVVFASTALSFYATLSKFPHPMAWVALPLLHGLPYCFLIFQARGSVKRRWERIVFHPSMLVFLMIVLLAGLIDVSLATNFAKMRWGPHPWSLLAPGEWTHAWLALLIPALAFLSFFHYFADAYLWRRHLRPERWR